MTDETQSPATTVDPVELARTVVPNGAGDGSGDPIGDVTFTARYSQAKLLGEGGMGSVEACLDRVVGREVAMKRIRADVSESDATRARFVREARVQGQLEHPAIVPVYDLGRDPSGAAYFTMKRVRGVTLSEVVHRLASGDREAEKKYTRRRLLSAMASVCLAVDFAHSRGVVHRDLKPANIMLGDFGEVYVLDWGIARVESESESTVRPSLTGDDALAAKGRTAVGALLGTPGFMAPEQCRGERALLGPATDVYALGAILFELLALEPLHTGRSIPALLESTLFGANARTSDRVPDADVPPELEAICVRATMLEPADRFPSARALHDAIDSYLEGERNSDLRRDLARQHVSSAQTALGTNPAALDASQRAEALREAGRALALDPGNLEAMRIIYRLIDEPPREVPTEVRDAMEDSDSIQRRITGRIASAGYASLVLYLPMLVWLGIRSATATLTFYALAAVALATTIRAALANRPRMNHLYAALVASNAAFGATATIFGPLFVTPMLIAVNTAAFALHMDRSRRTLAVGIGCVSILVPIVLQMAGVLPRSYAFEHGALIVRPDMVRFPEVPTLLFLAVTSVAGVITGSVSIGRLRDALVAAELNLQLQRWQLRHLVP